MKMLSYLLVAIPLFMVQKGFGLGENGNIEELSAMVESHIVAAENYVLPKDNAKLIKVDPYKIVGYYGTFDFIIIGAGTSGSVIANRLSEIGNWTVLLLEAGGHADDFSKILGLSSYLSYSDFNWGYNSTEQQNACLGRINQQCFLTQGRGLGGSTILNGAFYARGHPEDYNRWESVYGNPGWSYDKLLPYFKKSEHAVFYPRDKKFHGVYGPFTISQVNSTPGLDSILINSCNEIKMQYIEDYNGKNYNGISTPQFAVKGNERVTTASAFLDPIRYTRKNLKISPHSFVIKILIDDSNKAYGVKFIKNNRIYSANAIKQVIVSAGTINSAQLLMLSGIGPKDHLESLNIEVKRNLPVGKHLSDHVVFSGICYRTNTSYTRHILKEQIELYVKHEGLLVKGLGAEMVAFKNFESGKKNRADVEIIFAEFPITYGSKTGNVQFSLNKEYTNLMKSVNPDTDMFFSLFLLHPKSKGTVTLKSRYAKDHPVINPNYLSEIEDVEKLYRGVEFLLKFNQTVTFQKNNIHLLLLDYPGCTHLKQLSKPWWICAIKHLSSTVYHPIATNRMCPDPEKCVVNSQLQVHGLKNLLVADCSIIPELISGHTHAAALMIGEKGADLIKQQYPV